MLIFVYACVCVCHVGLVQLITVSWDLLAIIYQVPTWDPHHSRHIRGLKLNSFQFSSVCFNAECADRNPAPHLDVGNSQRRARIRSVYCTRFPTSISVSPENTVSDNEATSLLANVRGEEEGCILGIVQEHWAWGDAAAENPCERRRPIKGDNSAERSSRFGLVFVHKWIKKPTHTVISKEQLESVCACALVRTNSPTGLFVPTNTVRRSYWQFESFSKSKWSNSKRRL